MAGDACTGWPDGWSTWLGGTGTEWRHCCIAHDLAYTGNPTIADYLSAHWVLARCVGEVNWAMAATMFVGLITFGSGLIIHSRNRYGRRD